jgi:hypothetical protein
VKDESVSNVEYLGTCEGNDLRAIARDFDERKITHLAVMYRHEDGGVCYHVVGEGLTYLIGMSCRCIIHMHCKDSFVIPEQ